MTRDAIPQLHEPSEPRTQTHAYADASRRFGRPLAHPAMGDQLEVGRVADWTPQQLLEAATRGARDPNALEDTDVARICLAFVEAMRQLNDACRAHALISAENVHLWHRLVGTMPAAEVVARQRALSEM